MGGQGIIFSTTILAYSAIYQGYDVKVSEVHGMAQRGGTVEGSVRIAKKVFSPTIGKADILVALEKLEALRYVSRLKENGIIIVNKYEIIPLTANLDKNLKYPSDIEERIINSLENSFFIDAVNIAKKHNQIKLSNTVLLGFLSNFLPFNLSCWEFAIKNFSPAKVVDLNLIAFNAGRNLAV